MQIYGDLKVKAIAEYRLQELTQLSFKYIQHKQDKIRRC
jgi:hypothetical protein